MGEFATIALSWSGIGLLCALYAAWRLVSGLADDVAHGTWVPERLLAWKRALSAPFGTMHAPGVVTITFGTELSQGGEPVVWARSLVIDADDMGAAVAAALSGHVFGWVMDWPREGTYVSCRRLMGRADVRAMALARDMGSGGVVVWRRGHVRARVRVAGWRETAVAD